jgi:hypothetical protein
MIRGDGKTIYDIDILIADYYKTLKNEAYFELDGSIVPLSYVNRILTSDC